jgi:threonylcarbamoyladenosine tRNA methylthiotransferase MtaB
VKFAIVTFGCRVNQADSLALEERLRSDGGREASVEEADLVVVNTCAVTASAEQGARQTLRRVARLNPAARIVAAGCYVTRRLDEVAALPGVARLWTNDQKDRLTLGTRGTRASAIAPGMRGRTAYLLRAQAGCGEPCAYCIVPATRGRPRSLPPSAVCAEIARAEAAGFKEIVLTGVHLGAYGRDLDRPSSLASLLELIDSVPGLARIRVSSLEPMDCTNAVVSVVARSRRFAPHFHLPLQHASDRMLAAMRRPYDLDRYRRLVDHVRRSIPDASIGTDLIVGFPGETDEDARANLEYLRTSPLSYLHVFRYSDRPGTVAAGMCPKVKGITSRERAAELRAIGYELSQRFRRSQVGRRRDGLTLQDPSIALTDNYLKVRIPPGRARNERLTVRIVSATPVLRGVIVDGWDPRPKRWGYDGLSAGPAAPPMSAASFCAGDFCGPSTMSCPHAARISRPRLLRTETVRW